MAISKLCIECKHWDDAKGCLHDNTVIKTGEIIGCMHHEKRDPLNMKQVLEGPAMSNESADPSHYKTDGVECIDAIRSMLGKEGFIAYCRGNIMRYNWRLGKKDDSTVETQKAMVYQQWILDTLAGNPLTKKS